MVTGRGFARCNGRTRAVTITGRCNPDVTDNTLKTKGIYRSYTRYGVSVTGTRHPPRIQVYPLSHAGADPPPSMACYHAGMIPDVLKAVVETLQAAGLDVSITTEGGVAEVVVTDQDTGERYVVRDPDPWTGG